MPIKYVEESQKKTHTQHRFNNIQRQSSCSFKIDSSKTQTEKLPYYSKTEVELSYFKHSKTVFLMPNRVIFTTITIVAIQIVVILHLMAKKKWLANTVVGLNINGSSTSVCQTWRRGSTVSYLYW